MRPRSYFSDYVIAISVVLCSLALLAALGLALTGYQWRKTSRTLQVDFPNVAGIHGHSPVRYAGAPAGVVVGIRPLSVEERLHNADPSNAIRVTLGIDESIPPIPQGVVACLGSDTLLSEKFIALDAGIAGGTPLAEGAIIQGLSSPTFDDLMRHGGELVHNVDQLLPEVRQQLNQLLPKINALATSGAEMAADAKVLIAKADKLIGTLGTSLPELTHDAKGLFGKASQLIDDNEKEIHKSVVELPLVLDHLDEVIKKTRGVINANDKDLTATVRDLRLVMQDLRVVATYAKILTATLAEKPSRVIFSGKANPVPSEQEILKSRTPVPLKPAGR